MKWLLIYLLLINLAGFILCGVDKSRAIRHRWRISEKKIFLTAVMGGSVGVLIGIYGFRHKTRHKRFTVGVPMILLVQLLLVWMLYING